MLCLCAKYGARTSKELAQLSIKTGIGRGAASLALSRVEKYAYQNL